MTRPIVPAAQPWFFPTAQVHRLDNGLTVWWHHLPNQHVATVTAVVDLPLSCEPRAHEGLSALTLSCLDEGTDAHPGTAFSEALENHGAVIGGHHGLSAGELTVDFPASRLGPVLELFAEALTKPELTPDDVARRVAQRLADLDHQVANPAFLAGQEFRRLLFADASRAQRPTGGDREPVTTLTATLARSWHQRHYHPESTTIIIAGDLADPLDQLHFTLGSWSSTRPTSPVQLPNPLGKPGEQLIDRPDSVQAAVCLGGGGIDRADPRWVDFLVACHAVGGGFGSRLNTVLREEKGWTYGVRMSAVGLRQGGYWHSTASVRTDVVGPALETSREILRLTDGPLTDAEVDAAKQYWLGIAPLRYATADAVAAQSAATVGLGLQPDWFATFTNAITKVTAESANRAYNEIVADGDWRLTVVGDLAAAGL